MTICTCGKQHPWEPEDCPADLRQRLESLTTDGGVEAELTEQLGRAAGEALGIAADARDWDLVQQVAEALSVNDPDQP